jgi:branched-chain amino acid transport system permease protein
MNNLFIILNILCLVYLGWFMERLLLKEGKRRRIVISGILLLALALVATLPNYAAGYTPILMTTLLMYIILAVSWTLFSGPTGYMSLAPAAFFGVGMYAAALLMPRTGELVPLAVAVIAGGVASFLVALLVGAITLRLRGMYFAIFTFGLVMLISQLLVFIELHEFGIRGRFLVIADNTTIYYAMVVIFVVLLLAIYLIKRSKFGIALQSIGENEDAAAHMGVNVTMVKVITFAISAFFMGAVGAVWGVKLTYIDPYIAFNVNYSFLPVLMAIFGGMGQLYGPVIGAAIFAWIQEKLMTTFLELNMLIFGIILIAAILFLPNGLVGLIQSLWKRISGARHAPARG